MVEIIYYGYPEAPNPCKVMHALQLFRIPHSYCKIPITMPRPDFATIDITYRRSPLLSIDSDMYVDTSLIISKLCDIAQHTSHHVKINSNQRAYEALGIAMFGYGTGLIPRSHWFLSDENFLADRRELIGPGRPFDAESISAMRPFVLSSFKAYLKMIEQDILRDKTFFLEGDQPSIADIYVFYIVNWTVNYHNGSEPEVSAITFPKIFAWLDAVNAFLSEAPEPNAITWEEAKKILLAPPKHEFAKFVHHDENNSLGLKEGQNVAVTPTDTGKSGPQNGALVAINDEQVCLRNKSGLLMHFPILGYSIAPLQGGL